MKAIEKNLELVDYRIKLNNKLKNEKSHKEAEIESVKKFYDKQIETSKVEGENMLSYQKKKNDDRLIESSKDVEKRLTDYKSNLEKTQKRLGDEENILKKEHADKMTNMSEEYLNSTEEQLEHFKENQEETQRQIKSNMAVLNNLNLAERKRVENNAKDRLTNLASNFEMKENSTESNYRATLDQEIRNSEANLKLQRSEFKNTLAITDKNNKRLEQEKQQIQIDSINTIDKHQKDLLSQKQNDFKIRYENVVQEYDTLINRLKTHLDKDLKKIVESHASQKKLISEKTDDSFYQIQTLKPTVVEDLKNFYVSLNVAAHERENVHLSVHDRKLKISLSRKFSNSFEEESGEKNKSTRTELFSKEFRSLDLLNPRIITQKYEDGILSFKIAKL